MFRIADRRDIRMAIIQGDLPKAGDRPYHPFIQLGSTDRWEEEWQEAIAWCRDQFGGDGRYRRWFICRGQLFLCFNDEADATAFRLRWC